MAQVNNSQTIEHYILGKTLGVGAFGKVRLATHDITGLNVAIKIINKKKMKNSKMSHKIKREIRLLRYFNHPNIVRLYDVLDTNIDIFVVQEYISSGDLFDIIAQKGKLSEQEARHYFRQIVAGIEYCHRNLVAHRDLKPENILIDHTNTVKIADFGLSNLMRDGKYLATSCGSPNYAAPEVISGKLYCGTEIDTWSSGVILFAILSGYLPFDEEVIPSLFKKIREADYKIPSHFSKEAEDLVKRMLQPNPLNRIKFSDIKLHSWLRESQPFYIELFNQNSKLDRQKQINEEAYQKLVKLNNINFHGQNEDQIKQSIKKRENFSFIIAYDLIVDDITKNQIVMKQLKNQQEKQIPRQIFQPFIDGIQETNKYIENIYSSTQQNINQTQTEENQKKFNESNSQNNGQQNKESEWSYGVVYQVSAKNLMLFIYECLGQLDTTVSVKSHHYKIKCYHKNQRLRLISTTIRDPQDDFDDEDPGFQFNKQGEIEETTQQKANKYSRKQLIFTIQLYQMPDGVSHFMDIILNRGHPIMFLEFCNKFITYLNKYMSQVQNQQQKQDNINPNPTQIPQNQ